MVPEGSRGQGFKGSSDPPQNSRIKMLKNYKELNVWKKSYELCLNIYRITAKFPNEEKYGLTSQIRRSFVSILSNIAKGYGRKTTVDYIRMLYISYGSVCELGTAKKDIAEIERMLKALIQSLENKHLNP